MIDRSAWAHCAVDLYIDSVCRVPFIVAVDLAFWLRLLEPKSRHDRDPCGGRHFRNLRASLFA